MPSSRVAVASSPVDEQDAISPAPTKVAPVTAAAGVTAAEKSAGTAAGPSAGPTSAGSSWQAATANATRPKVRSATRRLPTAGLRLRACMSALLQRSPGATFALHHPALAPLSHHIRLSAGRNG